VRSLHCILKEHYNKADGFASDTVTVLDPAAGTLTFLAEAAKLAVEEFVSKYGDGGKQDFIRKHFLSKEARFYAFELMMAPYAVGHLKMSFLLEELGYKLQKDDRFKLYLTNTLEMEELAQTEFPFVAELSEESQKAGKVKKEIPILAILGNPPYSGISANMNPWIDKLLKEDIDGLQSYYKVDGKPLGEKKLWLQDDYVKFIRFAQWKIDQAGEGVLGFITNHSYLDNPTFRGMRQSLMNSFNEIYILDLHGNSLKKEKCPDGSKDENIFDIRQGVAIALFIKRSSEVDQAFLPDPTDIKRSSEIDQAFLPDTTDIKRSSEVDQAFLPDPTDPTDPTDKNVCSTSCRVYYSELWGLREEKYDRLLKNDVKTSKWECLSPTSPYYFFVPREEKGRRIYERYWKITDIFPVSVTGIVTARDRFVIDFDKDALKRRIEMFRNLTIPDELVKQTFKLKDTRGWKFGEARKVLAKDENWKIYFTKILYRPFDIRHIYYTQKVIDWPRSEVMPDMMQENLALCVGRAGQVVGLEKPWNVVFCSEYIEDFNLFYRGGNVNFPLYLYPDTEKKDMFSHKEKLERRQLNINPKLLEYLSKIYNEQVGQTFLSDHSEKTDRNAHNITGKNAHNMTGKNAHPITDRNVCSTNNNDNEKTDRNVYPTNDNEKGLKITRRKLPHWTLKGATYFVTFRTLRGELSVGEQKTVLEHIKEGDGKFYELIAVVIMPDHIHILLIPMEGYALSRIMKGVKGVSAHKINLIRKTKGNVWQDESYDRIIRDQEELNEKLNYMLNNPVKKGLTDDPWNYHGWYFNERYNETVGQTFLSDHEDKQECLSYQIFYYIYAVLYSNTYRKKYTEFLKIDFPRVPFAKDYKLFKKMAEFGERLVALHLMKPVGAIPRLRRDVPHELPLQKPIAKFQGKSDNRVEKLQYSEKQNRVYINKDQYFEGITKEVWQYQIGGYQACRKWLRDRKNRSLSLDDIKHYCRVATALQKTIEIQNEIDVVYPKVEKGTIEFENHEE